MSELLSFKATVESSYFEIPVDFYQYILKIFSENKKYEKYNCHQTVFNYVLNSCKKNMVKDYTKWSSENIRYINSSIFDLFKDEFLREIKKEFGLNKNLIVQIIRQNGVPIHSFFMFINNKAEFLFFEKIGYKYDFRLTTKVDEVLDNYSFYNTYISVTEIDELIENIKNGNYYPLKNK